MICPNCKQDDNTVYDTRVRNKFVTRRRECLLCGYKFTTRERWDGIIENHERGNIMNRVILSGRVCKDPEIRTAGETQIAKFCLAVDRKVKKGEEKKTDFINCTCFADKAAFVEKYFHKGDGMNLEGRIQTGSYKNKDGVTVYTTDVIVDTIEFPLSNGKKESAEKPAAKQDDFMNIPDDMVDELPFQ